MHRNIKAIHVVTRDGDARWYGVCTCGWKGETRMEREDAEVDCDEHEDDAEGTRK